jgi:ATP-dependent helicase/nuclease subunit A
MDYTPEQAEAILTHDCNLIVTAGAGSGKTRVLVDRFVALLDSHPDWPLPSLVAITFTEKAAREMRDRVRQAIEERIAEATETRQEAAIQHWRKHQAALDSARIGTIHSLCASILRANAAEIEIDPRFEVLDEIEARILRSDALDQALAELAGQPAARLLAEYGTAVVRDVLDKHITTPDDHFLDRDSFLQQWHAAFVEAIYALNQQLFQDEAFAAALQWEPPCTEASDKLMQSWAVVLSHRLDFQDAGTIPAAMQAFKDSIDLRGGKAAAWGGKETLDEARRLLKLIRERAETYVETIGAFGEVDEAAAERLPLWGEAIRLARRVYQRHKRSQRALDFDDLEVLTRDLLTRPHIAARYCGAEFRHILVDEFQDTNGAQRDIIYALAGLDRPGSLFVVGDPRQSIYAFRGADVSVFDDVRRTILALGGREISLDRSFRAHERLVGSFNAIFAALLTQGEGPTRAYEVAMGQPMIAHRKAEVADWPDIEIIYINRDLATENARHAEDLRTWEAWSLAQRLQQMVEAERPVWDKATQQYRPLRYGDVAVLFQTTISMPLVEEIFKAEAIPYVTVAGRGYYNRPEVWDLLNLLKALYNPLDDLSLAAALRSPLYGLSDDDLLALRLQRLPAGDGKYVPRLSLWAALTDTMRPYDPPLPDPERVAFARESLLRLYGIAGRVMIAELLAQALEETGYLATLSGLSDGARRCANVDKLVEVARRSGRVSLGNFTLYLNDLSRSEAREGEAPIASEGAVQLMTVHGSKGLEFPVVALFDASGEGKANDETLIVDPQLGAVCCVMDETSGEKHKPFAYRLAQRYEEARREAERTRLLYVGMTRAQDQVIVSGRSNGKGRWLAQLLAVLGLSPDEQMAEEQLYELSWGKCLVRVPRQQPVTYHAYQRASAATAWDALEGLLDQPAPSQPQPPPGASLLAPVAVDRDAPSRMLSATEIALLGEANAIGKPSTFRQHLLRAAPATIRNVAQAATPLGVSRRIIGEMVHQALRWGRLPGNTPDLHDVLDSLAWEQGITDPQVIDKAIQEAADLLARTERSDIIQQIERAEQVYRELPFTLKLGERTISGVIDVLYFSKYQRWNVVDFKTSAVSGVDEAGDESASLWERIREHASRYYAQIGVYALAVKEMTGQTPDTHLHYIRYVRTVHVEAETWQGVLASLDDDISAAMNAE